MALKSNLSYPSHLIRTQSLQILLALLNIINSSAVDLVEAMLSIETTPRTIENIRSTSLSMRRLPRLSSKEHDEILVPFCFGMLTVNFAPLWADAYNVLKAISERSSARIWEIAFSHLFSTDSGLTTEPEWSEAKLRPLSDQIWNDAQLERNVRLQCLEDRVCSS